MAAGILAILDDVAMLLDDTVVMSKLAAKKAAGLLGDDLAVNAEKATGYHASRELPVIWAITKGSFINKLIILPLAFLLSAYLPSMIVPILLLGGAYLSYEGVEKVVEWITRPAHELPAAAKNMAQAEILQSESSKIKSAVRTDFILSIEIIIISLETVFEQSLAIQIIVVTLIALLAIVAVYGVVALLVRMDDAGLNLIERSLSMQGRLASYTRGIGQLLINALPQVIRALGVIGTIAMLLVGGGMYVHNIAVIHEWLVALPSLAADLLVGLLLGLLLVGLMSLLRKFRLLPASH